MGAPPRNRLRRRWPLDPAITLLNHGSFGSCPRDVLRHQRRLRDRMERRPMQFFVRDLEPMLDAARHALAEFLGARGEDVVFVPNATAGVNTVLRSLQFRPGDEVLVTTHEYNACWNAVNVVAAQARARVTAVDVPFPITGPDRVIETVLDRVTRRTRFALLDHVTSPTGLIFPIARLVRELDQRGIDTLVDGAHAPGMVPLNLDRLGAAYYTGNCHKWLCAPKGAGFLHVRRDRQHNLRPLAISHGANTPRKDRSRFLIEFGWTGTWDPTAMLSVPQAIRFMGALFPGGWPAVMDHNRRLALAARRVLCRTLGIQRPCPDSMIGSLASVPLPPAPDTDRLRASFPMDPLYDRLRREWKIEVPVLPWPRPPQRLLRVSAQVYNALPEYERLANALQQL